MLGWSTRRLRRTRASCCGPSAPAPQGAHGSPSRRRPGGSGEDPRSPDVLSIPFRRQTSASSWRRTPSGCLWRPARAWRSITSTTPGPLEIWRGKTRSPATCGDEGSYSHHNAHNFDPDRRPRRGARYVPSHASTGAGRARSVPTDARGGVGRRPDRQLDPKCVIRGCPDRAVTKVVPTWCTCGPRVVIEKSVDLKRTSTGRPGPRTCARAPRRHARSVRTGGIRLDSISLPPPAGTALGEGATLEDDHIYFGNKRTGRLAIEVDTPRGTEARHSDRLRAANRARAGSGDCGARGG